MSGWSRPQRRLHWSTAVLVVLGFVVAWVMVALPLSQLLLKFLLYQLHKTIGLLVLGLTLVRLPIRLLRGRPAWEADLPAWQQHAAGRVHLVLYVLLLVVPVLGYLTAATAPAQVPTLFLGVINVPHVVGVDPAAFAWLRPLHRALAILLIVLATGHAAVAVLHHRRGRRVLIGMWRGIESSSAAPPGTPH